jgi:hypothetical protein
MLLECVMNKPDEVDMFLAESKQRKRRLLIGIACLLAAMTVVPLVLMLLDIITSDTFAFFVVADILLGAGAMRALIMRLQDSGDLPKFL